jgi:hypothetical protein
MKATRHWQDQIIAYRTVLSSISPPAYQFGFIISNKMEAQESALSQANHGGPCCFKTKDT